MMAAGESIGPWARKAEALYDDAYARKYRDRDEALLEERTYQNSIAWLQQVCGRFHHRIDVLDLGCGTGRYFWGVDNARSLVGFDASAAMLAEARHPIRADRITARELRFVQGDLATHMFPDAGFDLVYSIGVLAEHVPLDGLGILLAVDTIPDMFRTAANVTGAMTLTAILSGQPWKVDAGSTQ